MYGTINLFDGEIAQLARALGSYPKGRGFDSPSRYQLEYQNNQKWLLFSFKNIII